MQAVGCKNKLDVLTTEWLSWLQTNWRDSGYEVCFGIEDKLDKVIQEETAQFILQPQYTDDFQNICEGVLQMQCKVAVRNFHALSASR